ncbi:MAG: DVUA0089 family protein [Pseudomonadales bacterium]
MRSFKFLVITALMVLAPLGHAAVFTDSGRINDIDGDGDTLVDDVKISHFIFNVATAGLVTIDVDAEGFDSFIYLFDSNNNVLDENNDDNRDRVWDTDSYIQTSLEVGDYTVTIGQYWYSIEDALQGYTQNWSFAHQADTGWGFDYGNWDLTVNTPAPSEVPLPGALAMFLSALAGLGFLRRQ